MSAASDLSLFLAMKTNDKIIIIIKMLIAIDKIGTKSWLLVTIGSSCCVLLVASELNTGSQLAKVCIVQVEIVDVVAC